MVFYLVNEYFPMQCVINQQLMCFREEQLAGGICVSHSIVDKQRKIQNTDSYNVLRLGMWDERVR